MNINLIVNIVAPLIVSALCFGAGFYLSIKHGHYLGFDETVRLIFVPVSAGVILVLSVLLNLDKVEKHSQEQVSVETNLDANLVGYFIDIPEDLVTINLNETNSAEFIVFLGNSKSQDDTDGFSFSVLDLKRNELSESPIEVTDLKSNGKHSYTVTISAQKEGSYFIRVSHKLATFSSDVLVIVTTKEVQKNGEEA